MQVLDTLLEVYKCSGSLICYITVDHVLCQSDKCSYEMWMFHEDTMEHGREPSTLVTPNVEALFFSDIPHMWSSSEAVKKFGSKTVFQSPMENVFRSNSLPDSTEVDFSKKYYCSSRNILAFALPRIFSRKIIALVQCFPEVFFQETTDYY